LKILENYFLVHHGLRKIYKIYIDLCIILLTIVLSITQGIKMSESLYLTWDNGSEKEDAYKATANNIEAYDGLQKSVGYSYGRRTSYIDIEPNRSVRTSFNRSDYNAFRPGESVASRQKYAIAQCMQAYDRVGIIRNVIDLMSDFASQGLVLVHPNKSIEKFYRKWFQEINGVDRSERFLNYLYRCGNVIVRRHTAKVNRKQEKYLKNSIAADTKIEELKTISREIPWGYDFLSPLSVDVKVGTYTTVGMPEFVLKLSSNTYNGLMNSNQSQPKTKLPDDIFKRLQRGERTIPLDLNRVGFFYYKKDDWLLWANPMIYAILDDIIMLEKMKLADIAALDGAISNVRLWTLGDLEQKIIPTKAAINKLRDILASNVGGGTMDMVWGPELKFTESQSQVYRFLGSEKYQPVLTSIYAGLGIPPTLTGASSSGGYTNNYVSLKTLIERLEYGREVLASFWRKEIKIVQKAMGFRYPAEIHFDSIVLSDEAAQKQLLIQLADRDIISQETLLERFREIPTIEKVRVRREEVERSEDNNMPKKAGPYHNPHHKEDIAKIAMTKDLLDTKEYFEDLGLPASQNTPAPQNPVQNKTNKNTENNGRPLFSRDTKQRKQKRVLPRSSDTTVALWAIEAQNKISEILSPIALDHFSKKNIRSLTKAEFNQLEFLKLCILTGLEPFIEIDEKTIKQIMDSQKAPPSHFMEVVKSKVKSFIDSNKRQPSIPELRYIYSYSFAEMFDFNE